MSGLIIQQVKNKRMFAIGEQGTTWTLYIHLTDEDQNNIDLTNYKVRSHIRKKYDDPTPTAVFECSIIQPTEGKIQLYLPPSVTKTIQKGTYYMDVEIESPEGIVLRILEGTLTISPEVTKE